MQHLLQLDTYATHITCQQLFDHQVGVSAANISSDLLKNIAAASSLIAELETVKFTSECGAQPTDYLCVYPSHV